MTRDEYSWALEELAFALNKDNQHGEALSVANRCMEIGRDFACIYVKAYALKSLGRVSEAKSLVHRALSLPAITEFDAQGKELLQQLKIELSGRALPDARWVLPPNRNPSSRAERKNKMAEHMLCPFRSTVPLPSTSLSILVLLMSLCLPVFFLH
jgi:hypothetical protein